MNANEMAKELESLRTEIEKAKRDEARLEGSKDEVDKRLRGEFNCKTNAAGQTKLTRLRKSLEAKRETLEIEFEKLKDNYEW